MFPNIPTDNMYKFVAISGLVYLIFTLYHFSKPIENLENKIAKNSYEITKLQLQYALLDSETMQQHRYLNAFSGNLLSTSYDSNLSILQLNEYCLGLKIDYYKNQLNTKKALSDTLLMLIGQEMMLKDNLEKRNLLKSKLVEIEAKATVLKSLSEKYCKNLKFLWFQVFWGLLITVIGFITWYFKIQIHEDRAIAKK